MWGVVMGGKHTSIFYRGKRNVICKHTRVIPGFLFGWGLSSMGMKGRSKSGMPQSGEKGLLKQL